MSQSKSELIGIRDYIESDRNFILSTWLKGLRYGNDWFRMIDSDAYYRNYHAILERILADPRITIKVACLADDEEVILGYSVYSGNRLDWVFVKSHWRSTKIAKSLVPEGITVVSHLTDVGSKILKNKNPDIKFDPFSVGGA